MKQLLQVGSFCPNEACPDYGKRQSEQAVKNIKKNGKSGAEHQRFQCLTCGVTFTETKGTIFYGRHTPAEEILDVIAQVAEGARISSVSRTTGHKEETISDWLTDAAAHAELVEDYLLNDYKLSRAQIDGLWSYVRNKGGKKNFEETESSGQFWRSTVLEMDTRLRAARGIGKTETEASIEAFATLKRRGHPDAPPPLVSDGWGGIDDALLQVYGRIPSYAGRGRRPSHPKPDPSWQYLQIIKVRDAKGRLIRRKFKVVYGIKETVLSLFGLSTAYIERTHLTMRTFSSRLHRKTIAFSKDVDMHKGAAAVDDIYYNFCRSHKSLRRPLQDDPTRKWQLRSPAMAAGITDHIWTVKELFMCVPPPRKCYISNT